ncbi:ATP-binding cassette sub-family B member 8, mitochondrial [Eufriesea mexicana]|nr:ATP-binding cassette sub-family B member 8, mitochondrial [Eufriesea mexicana]
MCTRVSRNARRVRHFAVATPPPPPPPRHRRRSPTKATTRPVHTNVPRFAVSKAGPAFECVQLARVENTSEAEDGYNHYLNSLIFISKQKDKTFNIAKRKFNSSFKEYITNDTSKLKNLSPILKFGCGSLGCIAVTYVIKSHISTVEAKALKLSENIKKDSELTFKWKKFLEYLYPYLWQLLVALSSAMVVAILNIWIPQGVGNIINVLTKICQTKGEDIMRNMLLQLAEPAFALARISPQLTAATVLSLPTIILIGTMLGRGLRKLSMEAQNQLAKSTDVCEEAIQNIRTVKAFAAEEKEIEMFYKETTLGSKLYEKLGLGIGQLSPGELMAFLMATQTIQKSLSQLSLLFGSYVKGISAGARVFEYLEMPPSPMMVSGEIIRDQSFAGNITFKDVKFSYPTRPDHVILKNFNLHILAIVGSSGNGKSTIAALLERFYDVNDGSITIDGKDLRSLNASYLRGNVLGYIDQEPILFATSIMENIRYGKPDATNEDVSAIINTEPAKEANAHEFIMKFPSKYDTQVGERGAQLSGGQKQRIAIARALLKKPSILILDEATSALDYESERIVQKALDNVTQGRTVLIIAHRLSTIKNADVIVVLQRGMIAEMGTHIELIKKKGLYYSLVNEQIKENA